MTNPKDVLNFLKHLPADPHEGTKRILHVKEYVASYKELQATFYRQEYYKLYTAIKPNTTVLDIGAYVGDTAVYFAMHPDVKKVISYELSPRTFRELKWNISWSPLRKKIEVHNLAVRSKNGLAKSITLTKILAKLKPPIAIKCDIEGGEKDIFAEPDLKGVYAIELEYHYCKAEVRRTLEAKGFRVQDLGPMQTIGVMYASRP